MDSEIITLYRPCGQPELDRVAASGYRCWPPRLPEQPIFYPVANEAYAAQIARDWNTRDEANGYVTKFDLPAASLAQFPVQQVGGSEHTEYWIPAERLDEFNDAILGKIEVIRKFTPEGEAAIG